MRAALDRSDPLSRLAGQTGAGSAGQNQSFYDYRADGMRVHRGYIVNGNYGDGTNVRYRYDGQMGFEDREDASWGNSTTRYGLGARGVDLIERTDVGGTLVGFPLYDAHGNNVATLTRNGTSYAVNDRRSYDAWGVVRAQQSGGDPTLRYCASLGHKQDDESGMVYMRARYYEPGSGRFVSEDPSRDGTNWFAHCGNDPINRVDSNGRKAFSLGAAAVAFAIALGGVLLLSYMNEGHFAVTPNDLIVCVFVAVVSGFTVVIKSGDVIDEKLLELAEKEEEILSSPEEEAAEKSLAGGAIDFYSAEAGALLGEMIVDSLEGLL